MDEKIRLFAAARNKGREAAAASMRALRAEASTLGDEVQVVPVTLGDLNLTEDEVLNHNLFRSLVQNAFHVAASEGLVDKQNRKHQDLNEVLP